MLKPARRPLLALGLAIAALALGDHQLTRILERLDLQFGDALSRHVAAGLRPDPDIVIVDIDEASLARMQAVAGKWPWPRAVHAELIAGLLAQSPRAIVIDLLLAEPDIFRPESDAALREVLRGASRVYLPTLRLDPAGDAQGIALADAADALGLVRTPSAQPAARAQLLPPLVADEADWRTGAANFLEDRDGVGRRHALHLDIHGWRLASLPARVARDLGWPVPDAETIELHFRGGLHAFERVSYATLWEDLGRRQRQRATDEFRGRIVLVGTSAPGLLDARVTPMGSLQPGVELLATAIDNLRHQRWMTRPAPAWRLAATLTMLMLLIGALAAGVSAARIGAALAGLTLAMLGAALAAAHGRLLLPVVEPLVWTWLAFLGGVVLAYRRERRAREEAVNLFGRFLNPAVVHRLVERGETVASLSGRSRELTVLFSDIRGFTTLSENTDAAVVVQLLNRYFERQVEVVFRHGGTLDKFIGDCIMAFWGAPLDDPAHARRAVAAALEMQSELLAFREELAREHGAAAASFDVGIGIHSGPAVVGFIGSRRKLDYTAIGDTVNLASRIEGLTRDAGCRILVSDTTRLACERLQADGEAGARFDFIDRGAHHVKGRQQPVHLHEPRQRA
jgi:adenylate cyclase